MAPAAPARAKLASLTKADRSPPPGCDPGAAAERGTASCEFIGRCPSNQIQTFTCQICPGSETGESETGAPVAARGDRRWHGGHFAQGPCELGRKGHRRRRCASRLLDFARAPRSARPTRIPLAVSRARTRFPPSSFGGDDRRGGLSRCRPEGVRLTAHLSPVRVWRAPDSSPEGIGLRRKSLAPRWQRLP